jgi:hypothetical protein
MSESGPWYNQTWFLEGLNVYPYTANHLRNIDLSWLLFLYNLKDAKSSDTTRSLSNYLKINGLTENWLGYRGFGDSFLSYTIKY